MVLKQTLELVLNYVILWKMGPQIRMKSGVSRFC